MKLLPLILLVMILLTSCQSEEIRTSFMMDTLITYSITSDDPAALADECEALTSSLEELFSAHLPDSEIYKWNSRTAEPGGISFSDETLEVIATALDVSAATDGAYDITVAPIVSLWDIAGDSDSWSPPAHSDIRELLPLVGSDKLKIEGRTLGAPDGVRIDLGGIGKGYALGSCAELLRAAGATGTVSFGGNVALIGQKSDGTGWRIGMKNPAAPDTVCGVITIDSGIIAVSGGYERFREHGDSVYHHIIDPSNGYPSDSDIASAAVIVESADRTSGALADALSTALFVMGSCKAEEFRKNSTYEFEYILVLKDGSILTSENMTDRFTAQNQSSP